MSLSKHSLAKKISGEVWAWGYNNYGQLGDNTIVSKSSPVLVVGNHSFVEIEAMRQGSVCRKANGEVWAWGFNDYGQLGDESITPKYSPVLVVGNHSFVEIAAGSLYHNFARKIDGSVWAWGYNDFGQLGDNTIVGKSSPVLVVGNHSFVEITAGSRAGYGRKSDGQIWSWGRNNVGQLGDNTIVSKSSPVLIVGNHSFVEIAGSELSFLSRKADGSVWACGYGLQGQLGDNTIIDKSSPVLVVGNHSFVEISGGIYFYLARKTDGSIWSWGRNEEGQLGDNTLDNKSSPVLVVGNHSFVGIATGDFHSLGRKVNGEVWAWGDNSSGQLGDESIINKSSPILVVGSHSFNLLIGEETIEEETITQTIQVKSRIKILSITYIIDSKVNIKVTQESIISAKAKIKLPWVTIEVKASIKKIGNIKTIQSKAGIFIADIIKGLQAKASIVIGYPTLVRKPVRFPRGKIEISWDKSKNLAVNNYQYINESDYVINIESYEELEGALGESVSSEVDFMLANNTERFYPKEFKNKLKNPSFELTSTPTFWSPSASGVGAINTNITRTRIRSYKIDAASAYLVSDNIYIASGLGEEQIQQDENWVFSMYVQGTGTAALKLYAFDITNEGQDLTTGLLDSDELTNITLSGTWGRSQINLLVPNGTASLRARLMLEAGGSVLYADDAMVERGSIATDFQDINEAIWHLLLPNRPVAINIGFAPAITTISGIDYQKIFSGLTENLTPNLQEETIQIHCLDWSSKLMEMKSPSLMYTNQRTDQLLQYLAWAAGLSITGYNFETGTLTIPFAWFTDEESIWYWMKKLAEAENGRIFFDHDGILQFWNKNHYINNQIPVFTYSFNSNISGLNFEISPEKIVNHVVVKAKPRQEQVNQIIWVLQGYETIPANSSLDYEITVDDPCTVINEPVATADYLGNTQSDGSGDDRTSYITISDFEATAKKATMKINNSHPSEAVYITLFQVKGKPATVTQEMEIEVKDTESVSLYRDKILEIENDYIQDLDDAETLAKRRIIELRDPLDFIEIEVVGYPKLTVGDVVNVQDSYNGTTKKLFVVANRISLEDEVTQSLRLESKILNF